MKKVVTSIMVVLFLVSIVYASQYTQQIYNSPPLSISTGLPAKKSFFIFKPFFFSGTSEDCACITKYECKPNADGKIQRDCFSSGGKCYCYLSPAGDKSDCSFHENICGGGNLPYCPTSPPHYCHSGTCLSGYSEVSGYWCPEGSKCCKPCTSKASYRCYGGDVWWYDSCGNRENERKDWCDDGCENGQCTYCKTDADCGNNICDGNVATSYKCVSGDCEAKAIDCKNGCENGVCKTSPVCEEKAVGNPYCDGDKVVQLYQYSSCQKSGKVLEECSYECAEGRCVDQPLQCDCDEPTEWSTCEGVKTRTVYKCGLDTNYQCIRETETASCAFDEICTNGVDDDSDGYLDCDDSECFDAEACETPPATCGDGQIGSDENCANCPADVKCSEGFACDSQDGKCKQPPSTPIIPVLLILLLIIVVAGFLMYKVSKK